MKIFVIKICIKYIIIINRIKTKLNEQIDIGIELSDVIFFMIDGRSDLNPTDYVFAKYYYILYINRHLRKYMKTKNIFVLMNKTEGLVINNNIEELYDSRKYSDIFTSIVKLGFGFPIPISSEHSIYLNLFIFRRRNK